MLSITQVSMVRDAVVVLYDMDIEDESMGESRIIQVTRSMVLYGESYCYIIDEACRLWLSGEGEMETFETALLIAVEKSFDKLIK